MSEPSKTAKVSSPVVEKMLFTKECVKSETRKKIFTARGYRSLILWQFSHLFIWSSSDVQWTLLRLSSPNALQALHNGKTPLKRFFRFFSAAESSIL